MLVSVNIIVERWKLHKFRKGSVIASFVDSSGEDIGPLMVDSYEILPDSKVLVKLKPLRR